MKTAGIYLSLHAVSISKVMDAVAFMKLDLKSAVATTMITASLMLLLARVLISTSVTMMSF